MANQDLQHRTFVVPANIVGILQQNASTYNGTENKDRIQGILANPNISYFQIKRIKNYFDYADPNSPEFNALGGQEMKNWIDSSLGSQRNSVQNGKKIKTYTSPNNEYLKPHDRDESQVHKQKVSRIPRAGVNAQQIMNSKPVYEQTNIQKLIKEELSQKHREYVKGKIKETLVKIKPYIDKNDIAYWDNSKYNWYLDYYISDKRLWCYTPWLYDLCDKNTMQMEDFKEIIKEIFEELTKHSVNMVRFANWEEI